MAGTAATCSRGLDQSQSDPASGIYGLRTRLAARDAAHRSPATSARAPADTDTDTDTDISVSVSVSASATGLRDLCSGSPDCAGAAAAARAADAAWPRRQHLTPPQKERKHRDAKLRHKRLLALEWPASVVAIDMLLSLLLRGVAHAASARPEATCLKAADIPLSTCNQVWSPPPPPPTGHSVMSLPTCHRRHRTTRSRPSRGCAGTPTPR